MTPVRVVTFDVHGLRGGPEAAAAVIRPLRPDVVLVQGAPWRLRWRTPTADLARALGLYVAAGGKDAAGNLVLTGLRVSVTASWSLRYPLVPGRRMRGAVLARCEVGTASFVVAGTQLAPEADERAAQADVLARALTEQSGPVLVAGRLDARTDGAAWTRLAEGRTDVGRIPGQRTGDEQLVSRHGAILAGPGLRVGPPTIGRAGVAGFAPIAVDVTVAA